MKRAVAEYEQGHWTEAKAFFLRAHQRKPSARTLRGLGLAAYELRSYVEALIDLRQALASKERPLTEDMRAEVKSTIEETKTFIAYDKLVLEPHDVTVRVDGQPAVFDDDGALLLDPGQHEIQLESAGFEPLSHDVTAKGGEHNEVRLTLRPQSASASLQPTPARLAAAQSRDSSFWESLTIQHKVGLVLAAGGVVGLGVGTTFGILALSAKSAAKGHCPDDICDTQGFSSHNSALRDADVASLAFIAGGALIVGGAIVYFTAPERHADAGATAVAVTPIVGNRVTGAAVGGRF